MILSYYFITDTGVDDYLRLYKILGKKPIIITALK
jgi:hypothetical protein